MLRFMAYLFKYILTRYRVRFFYLVKNKDVFIQARLKLSKSKMTVNLGDWVQFWIFMEGAYELEMVEFVDSCVKGKVFFDVGANVGSYSMNLHQTARQI